MLVTFLSLSDVLEIHQDQIVRYGGQVGVRDINLLKSALGMPSATFGGEYLHTNIYEMAAAYLFHLVNNHPFVDGNKRVGAVASLVFLIMNGYDLNASEDDLTELVLSVAKSEVDKAAVAVFIHRWSSKI